MASGCHGIEVALNGSGDLDEVGATRIQQVVGGATARVYHPVCRAAIDAVTGISVTCDGHLVGVTMVCGITSTTASTSLKPLTAENQLDPLRLNQGQLVAVEQHLLPADRPPTGSRRGRFAMSITNQR